MQSLRTPAIFRAEVGMQIGKFKLKPRKCGRTLFTGPHNGQRLDPYGEFGESEVALMYAFLAGVATVIDVSANIGDLTVSLARRFGDSERVLPLPP
jgi:hypothetical protein